MLTTTFNLRVFYHGFSNSSYSLIAPQEHFSITMQFVHPTNTILLLEKFKKTQSVLRHEDCEATCNQAFLNCIFDLI